MNELLINRNARGGRWGINKNQIIENDVEMTLIKCIFREEVKFSYRVSMSDMYKFSPG